MKRERHETPHGGMIIFPEVLQGSEEWEVLRRGRPTASNFSKILTPATMKLSAQSKPYMFKLLADMFQTDVQPSFMGTPWTDRGRELEPKARRLFSLLTGLDVAPCGFATRLDEFVGCSPDGMILDPVPLSIVAGLELKCPAPETHVAYVAGGGLPDDHKVQVHGCLAVTGLNEWHFFSYCPGMNPFHVVVQRDSFTEKLSVAIDQFVIDFAAIRSGLIEKLKHSPATLEALRQIAREDELNPEPEPAA